MRKLSCACGGLLALSVYLIVSDFTAPIPYFKGSPDVPIYLGILLGIISTLLLASEGEF
ncbi:hypothetical protein [Acidianus sp. HS-5]|uniref:hypothetical protein n=1 Tax=Acidianus sp. HS-5 TaxID=2886040 RepID=UPI001F1C5922|nr:hypothetical protein [Acidianus sp. HS-5]BDC17625.1 hypothetical protein HS5_05150 [Acidianus sp. HS-5]